MVKKLLIIIGVLILNACTQLDTLLIDKVDQDSANTIVLNLGNQSIATNLEIQKDGSFNVFVTKNDQLAALNILHDLGIPQKEFTNFGEVFKKDGFLSSPLEEHGRFIYAMNQEIGAMLSAIDGVTLVKAKVSMPAPDDNLWSTNIPKPSAAVLIKYTRGTRIDLYINRIKNLVSNSVPGLTPERVEILTMIQKDTE